MALTKAARNKINSLVQQAKRLLMEEVEAQLAQHYGIRPDGTVLPVEELATKNASILYTATLLRQRLDYLKTNIPNARERTRESFAQLVREQAFTILNRFASLRLAEERGIIRESVRQGYNSEGFLVFDQLTGESKTAPQFERYRWYLFAIFDELAQDLPSVFSRFSPYALLFPGEAALLQLLARINDGGLTIHREEGLPAVNLWQEDETIGWMYQYYNSREEIKAMRDASNAPRNSRELAVRNQFFTPRYVVQFLTDNSLGRIWYEMNQGQTTLAEFCEYLVRQPQEVFLPPGLKPPAREEVENTVDADDEPVYIEHRPLKDPRDLSMIDPACGSMHFGLYAFDLYEKIYLEAWDKHPRLLQDLREKMTRAEFERLVPSLIIRYNIHGVDIDPRAVQIAGLSLWLRAQRSFQRLGLPPAERPPITKANLVCAEPMPGDPALLEEFLRTVDAPLRPLVRTIWDKMQLAGETGLLLKIEEELKSAIAQAREEWARYQNVQGVQGNLFNPNAPAIQLEFDQLKLYKRLKPDFFEQAEEQVLDALQRYAEAAANGSAYRRLLFAEDTARGFAFIDLCRKKYDVVLMNPPFGEGSKNAEVYYKREYPWWAKNILCCFFGRMLMLLDETGEIGAIFDRTAIVKSTYKYFRTENLIERIRVMVDTGWDVLDANVETTILVLNKQKNNTYGHFIDAREESYKTKAKVILDTILSNGQAIKKVKSIQFLSLPNAVIGYELEEFIINLFTSHKSLRDCGYKVSQGHTLSAFQHIRLYWEPLEYDLYKNLYHGGGFSMFYQSYRELTVFGENGRLFRHHLSTRWSSSEYQLFSGVGYGKRGEVLDAHILQEDSIFTHEGMGITKIDSQSSISVLSYLNSVLAQFLISTYTGQHKQVGEVNLLPIPAFLDERSSASLKEICFKIIKIKRFWKSQDETVKEYRHLLNLYSKANSIRYALREIKKRLQEDAQTYTMLIDENDDFWLKLSGIPEEAYAIFNEYKSKRPQESLWFNSLQSEEWETSPSHAYEIIQAIVGVIFGRWDIRSILDESLIPPLGELFDPLPFMPVVSLKEIPEDYPVTIPLDGILPDDSEHERDITKVIRRSIHAIWSENAEQIEQELCELGQINNLRDYICNHNGFFGYHLERYTKSRRMAPIYWPLSTESGSYTVWLYYPRLTDQTLYKVVNDFVAPKLAEIEKQLRTLQLAEGKPGKALNELRGLEQELLVFKEELLRVVALPYQPNHDDGVLITAAPLHRLFRHPKWRKVTEACWRQLDAGEYDWAHLTYSIWPERVQEKCKTDLSMAIAHGLEEIYEVEVRKRKNAKKRLGKKT